MEDKLLTSVRYGKDYIIRSKSCCYDLNIRKSMSERHNVNMYSHKKTKRIPFKNFKKPDATGLKKKRRKKKGEWCNNCFLNHK